MQTHPDSQQRHELVDSGVEFYKALFNHTGDGMFLLDFEGRIIQANPAICKRLDYTCAELRDMSLADVTNHKHLPSLNEQLHTLIEKGQHRFQTIQSNRDGSLFPTDIMGNVFLLGNRQYLFCIARNITDCKKTEQRLRQYEHIISATSDLMSFVDRHYVYKAVNEAYLKSYGKESHEILGRTVADLMGTDVFESDIKKNIDRCFCGETVRYQAWFDYPVGKKYMDVSYYPFREPDGKITGLTATIHDLTELKMAETAREIQKERIRSILESMPDGVYIVNRQYEIEYVNPVVEAHFGPVKGKKCYQLSTRYPIALC